MKLNLKKLLFATVGMLLTWVVGRYLDGTILATYLTGLGSKNGFEFMNQTVSIWQVGLWAIISFLVYLLLMRTFGKEARRKRAQQSEEEFMNSIRQLLRNQNRMEFMNGQLLLKYDVVFHGNKIDLRNFHPYCNRHEAPLRMEFNRMAFEYQCSDRSCPFRFDDTLGTNLLGFKNQALAKLEHEWEQLSFKV